MATCPIKIQQFPDRTKSHVLYSDNYIRPTLPLIDVLVIKTGQKYSMNELALDDICILNLIMHSRKKISLSRATIT
jgi:hypothetical protein